jgi:TonB family protein
MMSAYANGLRKPENFDSYVRKFRVICVTHEIETGPRADVALFLKKLAGDRHLAMDFWAFVGKLSDREGGELNDDQILAVILEGITQGEISPDDGDLKLAVEDLRAMLAGVDVHGHVQIEPEPFSRGEPDPFNHVDKWPPAGPQKISGPQQIPAPFASDSGTHRASDAGIPPQLDQTLHRLELTNLELQQHLDEIDRRMSRLEPILEEQAPVGTSLNDSGGRTAAGSRFARMEELAHKPGSSGRLVLEPTTTAPAEEPFARKTPLSAHVPLEDYAEHHGYGKAVLSLLLVLALAAAGFFGYRDREPLQQKLSSLVQELQNKIRPANTASPADTSVQQPEQTQTPSEQPRQGTSTPPPVSPVTRNATTQAAAPARTSQKQQEQPDSNRKSIADRIATQAAQTPPDGISNADLAGAIRVSPAVMESRLVDSRVPAYPDSAKLAGVEGSVIMQAIISRNGTVRRVHVIQGDSRLRGPAVDAVYKWRYRPYLLDGQPVDVATTISVDFDLDR